MFHSMIYHTHVYYNYILSIKQLCLLPYNNNF
jgi:hypothetical protein